MLSFQSGTWMLRKSCKHITFSIFLLWGAVVCIFLLVTLESLSHSITLSELLYMEAKKIPLDSDWRCLIGHSYWKLYITRWLWLGGGFRHSDIFCGGSNFCLHIFVCIFLLVPLEYSHSIRLSEPVYRKVKRIIFWWAFLFSTLTDFMHYKRLAGRFNHLTVK